MSFEDSILLEILRAAASVNLEVIVIGNAAAALQGVPVATQDIDLFLRDTPGNAEKIKSMVEVLGRHVRASRPFEPVSRMIRIEGLPVDIDLVFELSSRTKFESLRARSHVVSIEGVSFRVADLSDLIAAKRAAGRPKDLATLPILEQFLRVKQAMDNQGE
jgi:predicted nucleotidyltransferase